MTQRFLARWQQVDSDRILEALSSHQHMRPHQSLADALEAARMGLGFSADASDAAMRALAFDASRAIGRLRRGELVQLSRAIHRHWRGSPSTETAMQSSIT